MPVEPILIRRRFGLPPSPLRRLRPARRGVACVAIAVWFAAGVVAQGPLKRDRWRFAHLQSLREVLWTKTQGADARTAAAIEAAFAAPTRGRIFTPIVAAFAALEANSASSKSTPDAVEPSATQPDAVAPENDAIGRLATRLVLHGYSVPEVVDPESTLEICREYHVSAGLASLRPDLEPLAALILEVFAADREPSNSATEATVDPLFRQVIETGVSSDDLLRFLPRFTVPTTAWEDGAYTWQLRAVFKADAPPSPVDPNGGRPPESTLDPAAWRVLSEPTWATGRFLVTRGYQQRAEGLFAQAKGLVETASPVDRAALVSALAQTGEAYAGEPPLPHRDPVEALTRLKRMIDNVQEERFAWDGIDGWMTIGAPVSATTDGPDEYLRVALRLPTDASMAQLSDARRSDGERSAVGAMVPTTLVIVVPGSAAFDVIGDRPESPRTVDPLATAIHLHPPSASPDGLAGTDALCVAVMEAPGRLKAFVPGATYAAAWLAQTLRSRFGRDVQHVVWVGARDGAAVTSLIHGRQLAQAADADSVPATQAMPPTLALVLSGGCLLQPRQWRGPRAARVLGIAMEGSAANQTLLNLVAMAGKAAAEGEAGPHVTMLPGAPQPWPFVLRATRDQWLAWINAQLK